MNVAKSESPGKLLFVVSLAKKESNWVKRWPAPGKALTKIKFGETLVGTVGTTGLEASSILAASTNF